MYRYIHLRIILMAVSIFPSQKKILKLIWNGHKFTAFKLYILYLILSYLLSYILQKLSEYM